jgi:hypothetical protein
MLRRIFSIARQRIQPFSDETPVGKVRIFSPVTSLSDCNTVRGFELLIIIT